MSKNFSPIHKNKGRLRVAWVSSFEKGGLGSSRFLQQQLQALEELGVSIEIKENVINFLKNHGNIYITSERTLEKKFEKYRISIPALDIHHVMAFAKLYIGDSQTMAAESGVLGVPFIRFNDFVGKISYLDELENKYQLGYGIKTSNPNKLIETVKNLVSQKKSDKVFMHKRKNMLKEKIDYSKFLVWFIENYPLSLKKMKKTPKFQFKFL